MSYGNPSPYDTPNLAVDMSLLFNIGHYLASNLWRSRQCDQKKIAQSGHTGSRSERRGRQRLHDRRGRNGRHRWAGGPCKLYFFKQAIPGLFLFIFGLFQMNINTILQQIILKEFASSIWHWDSNPRPSECESPPITTWPGLPPKLDFLSLMSFII